MDKIICLIILCFVSTHHTLASHAEQPLSLDEMVNQMVAVNNKHDAVFVSATPDSNQAAFLELQFNGLQDAKIFSNKAALIKQYGQIDPKSHISPAKDDETKILVWVSNCEVGAKLIEIYALEGDKQAMLKKYYEDVHRLRVRDNSWHQIPAKKKSSCCLLQ